VVRVRVLFSKNRLKTLLPRSSGTFFTSRSLTLEEGACGVEDVVDHRARQALDREQVDQFTVRVELRVSLREHQLPSWMSKVNRPSSSRARRRRCSRGSVMRARRVGRLDRELAPAAVDQHRERHAGRAAEIEQFVDDGARRAAGVEHVRRSAGSGGRRPRTAAASGRRWDMPRDAKSSRCSALGDHPDLARQLQLRMQPLGQPGAARPDADQHACGLQQARTPRSSRRTAPRRRGARCSWQVSQRIARG
jgi:hypothetical protein